MATGKLRTQHADTSYMLSAVLLVRVLGDLCFDAIFINFLSFSGISVENMVIEFIRYYTTFSFTMSSISQYCHRCMDVV